jgi:hypothetical protein
MRAPFSHLFHTNSDGSISARISVYIDGTRVEPSVPFFPQGVSFGGVNIASLIGHDLEIQQLGSAIIVVGYY